MTFQNVLIDGKKQRLGKRVGRGGEGDVFLLEGNDSIAVKIYTLNSLGDRPEKINAFVQEKLYERASQVAFPIAIVCDSTNGKFIGFTMKMVANCKPLHELYAPGSRKIYFPKTDYRFLVRTASNIARAVAAVHATSCVIGDINHSGILVSEKALVSLIDADSFQVKARSGNYLCKVGVPEYTPPELQGASLEGVIRTANHDAFGLAVVVFQLLFMGRHPFVGTVRRGDIPPLYENIKSFRYVYTDLRNVGMDQPPGTPSIADFYPDLARYFDKAFGPNGAVSRPTASEWVKVLDELESKLVQCSDNSLHFIPQGGTDCAWCEMEKQLGSVLFIPHFDFSSSINQLSSGTFDLESVWLQISSINKSFEANLIPKFNNSNLPSEPSTSAKNAKNNLSKTNILGPIILIGSVVGFFTVPAAFILWLIAGWFGYCMKDEKKTLDPTPFTSSYEAHENIYIRELSNWQKKFGIDQFVSLYTELENAYEDYKLIQKDEQRQVSKYSDSRRDLQLKAFLESFPIDQVKIKGIGPSKRAVLASYGIDTASDIEKNKLLRVPGFGEATSMPLLQWRSKIEARFVYRPDLSNSEKASIAQIKLTTENKLKPLRTKLSSGAANLRSIVERIKKVNPTDDANLLKAMNLKAQAKFDLEYLGIPIPYLQKNNSSSSSRLQNSQTIQSPVTTPRSASTKITLPSSSAVVLCPRCGNSMTKRLAKKGRNAGHYFWGCSRYPGCKGTRNI